jgi:hypothetical protein
MYCCETGHRPHEAMRHSCGCQEGSFHRRYISPEEEKQFLKDYKEQLKKEQEGIEARLKELEG